MSIVKHVFVSLTTCAEQLPESITFVTAPGSFIVRATAMNLIRVFLMLALLFTPQVRASNESDKVVMQLNWTHAFQFAGYYAAKEQGYYREAGLDVEFREGGPGIDVLQQVTQGEAQFGVGNSSLLLARQQGKPVVVLGVIFQHSPLVLIGRQDLGIHSLSDLIGKRVMIESHSDELFAYMLLKNVPREKLHGVPFESPMENLLNGKVAAISAYKTYEPYLLEQAHVPFQIFSPVAAGIDFYGDNLFTNATLLKDKPHMVEAFRAASMRGWQYAMQNPEESIELILRQYAPRLDRNLLTFEANAMRPLLEADLIDPGYMKPERWNQILLTYQRLGLTHGNGLPDGFTYTPPTSQEVEKLRQSLFWVSIALFIGTLMGLYMLHSRRRIYRAKEALKESESRYRILIEGRQDVVWAIDLDAGRFTYLSPMIEKMTGYSANEIMARSLQELDVYESINRHSDEFNRGTITGDIFFTEERLQACKQGEPIWIELVFHYLRNEQNGHVEVHGVMRNINNRMQMEQQADQLLKELNFQKFALDQHSIVSATDGQGNIIYVNDKFIEVTGYSADELLGQSHRLIKSDVHDELFYQNLWETILGGHVWHGELCIKAKNDKLHWLNATIVPFAGEDGVPQRFVAIRTDISQLKLFEANLTHTLSQHQLQKNLLALSMRDISMDELLDQALKEIMSTSALSAILDRGAIFLMDALLGKLRMVAQHDLHPHLLTACREVNLGHCLCGRAAASQELLFVNHVDDKHEIHFDGMSDHGHYCVPIKNSERLFGVFTLYVSAGHEGSAEEKDLLQLVSNTLAVIIERKKAEEAIQKAQLRLAHAQAIAHIGSWTWHLKRGNMIWSAEMFRIYGEEPHAFEPGYESAVERVHPEDRDKVACAITAAIDSAGTPFEIQHRILRPDGSERVVMTMGQVVTNEQGEPELMQGVIQDITERARLEQHEKDLIRETKHRNAILKVVSKVQAMFIAHASSNEAFELLLTDLCAITESKYGIISEVKSDPDGAPYLNVVALSNLSWSEETQALYEQSATTGLPFRDLDNLLGEPLRSKEVFICNQRSTHPRSGGIPAGHPPIDSVIGLPLLHGDDLIGLIYLANRPGGYDQQVAADLAPILASIVSILEARRNEFVRQETERNLAIAKEEAEAATRVKAEFLATMSHEIRTPMNAVLGLANLCLQTELGPKARDYLNKINASAGLLLGIINDILDFSKIEAGKLKLEHANFNLDELLGNVNLLFAERAKEKGIELIFDLPPDIPSQLRGDALRIGQVLTNLIGNAIKFTENGRIALSIRPLEVSGETIEFAFSVRDTGIGMSPEQTAVLFTAFTQADMSTSRQYGGTGLGLAISQQLVRAMEGEIKVESKPGEGSTFSFNIHLERNPERTTSYGRSLGEMSGRVLVVDDDRVVRMLLKRILEKFGFQVLEAESSAACMALFEQPEPPELLLALMDWRLPDVDGVATTEKIHAIPRYANLPVVMVTAANRDEIEEIHAKGINRFLIKPISPSTLFDTVQELLYGQVRVEEQGMSDTLDALQDIHGARVLLVEDHPINQQVAREIMEGCGLVVETLENGALAVERVLSGGEPLDAVLMDVQMPVMDGYEATRRIREHARYMNLPIIAMTANVMEGDQEKRNQAGMNDLVAKPIDLNTLYKTLIRWIPARATGASPSSSTVKPLPMADEEGIVLPDQMSGLEVKQAVSRLNGNASLFLRLLAGLRAEAPQRQAELRSATETAQWADVQRLAHTVKGLAGNLGAVSVAAAARALESAVKSDDLAQVNELVDVLEATWAELIEVTEALPMSYSTGQAEAPAGGNATPPEELRAHLAELDSLLGRQSFDAEKRALEITPMLAGTPFVAEWNTFRMAIENFDFANAKQLLEQLIIKMELLP